MHKAQKYRRIKDGLIIEAVQYQPPWKDNAGITKVASFILGIDTDRRVAVPNEDILDVVRPLTHLWHVGTGVGTIEIIDPTHGIWFHVQSGDWIGRTKELVLMVINSEIFSMEYEEAPPEVLKSDFDLLSDLIYDNFPWEGERYQAVAEQVAAVIIGTGWSRKELS